MPVPPEIAGNRAYIVKMGQLALRNEKVLTRTGLQRMAQHEKEGHEVRSANCLNIRCLEIPAGTQTVTTADLATHRRDAISMVTRNPHCN